MRSFSRHYRGEKFHALLCDQIVLRQCLSLHSLKRAVCLSMAGRAERDEVLETIGLSIVREQPERNFVVDLISRFSTMLASVFVPPASCATLRLPIRSVPIDTISVDELRVKFSNSKSVSALSGAESSSTFALCPAWIACKRSSAPLTGVCQSIVRGSCGIMSVLALFRAMATTPMLNTTWRSLKLLFTPLADECSHSYKYKQIMGRRQV